MAGKVLQSGGGVCAWLKRGAEEMGSRQYAAWFGKPKWVQKTRMLNVLIGSLILHFYCTSSEVLLGQS